MTLEKRDHGGGLDAAIKRYGGTRNDWLDLSTGINPNPYPVPDIPLHYWHNLPDEAPQIDLLTAARKFWNVPDGADIVPASGVSAIIAMLPNLVTRSHISILNPTYNEFAAAFDGRNKVTQDNAPVQIRVHPNNPDGRIFTKVEIENQHDQLTVIDESFCDVCPDNSLIDLAQHPNHIILKGTGKFWGLAGLRLGFAIAHPETAQKISQHLGPWNISGPAQFIGRKVLEDNDWAQKTRLELSDMTKHLRTVLHENGLTLLGGTDLFQLAETKTAKNLHIHLCKHSILTRAFPYSETWIRMGLPANAKELSHLNVALGCY